MCVSVSELFVFISAQIAPPFPAGAEHVMKLQLTKDALADETDRKIAPPLSVCGVAVGEESDELSSAKVDSDELSSVEVESDGVSSVGETEQDRKMQSVREREEREERDI